MLGYPDSEAQALFQSSYEARAFNSLSGTFPFLLHPAISRTIAPQTTNPTTPIPLSTHVCAGTLRAMYC